MSWPSSFSEAVSGLAKAHVLTNFAQMFFAQILVPSKHVQTLCWSSIELNFINYIWAGDGLSTPSETQHGGGSDTSQELGSR